MKLRLNSIIMESMRAIVLTDKHGNISEHGCGTRNISFLNLAQRIMNQLQTVWVNAPIVRSEEHTSELQSRPHLVCRLLLEKKNLSMVLMRSLSTKRAA